MKKCPVNVERITKMLLEERITRITESAKFKETKYGTTGRYKIADRIFRRYDPYQQEKF